MQKHPGLILAIVAAAALSACGGGGGDGDSGSNVRAALPTLSQDVLPSGARLDLRERNYFPAAAGDRWTYDHLQAGVTTGPATRTVAAGSGGTVVITEGYNGEAETSTYRRTADGIVIVKPLDGVATDAAQALIGDLLEYAEPFYATGTTRQSIRQGSWGGDLDGDGIDESFRLEVSQVLVGFEDLTLPDGVPTETARFRNVTKLTLSPSSLSQPVVTVTATENAWWAPNIGPVRAERSAVDSNGTTVLPLYTLTITGGNVGGNELFLP